MSLNFAFPGFKNAKTKYSVKDSPTQNIFTTQAVFFVRISALGEFWANNIVALSSVITLDQGKYLLPG